MSELLPCPFCGGNYIEVMQSFDEPPYLPTAECSCGANVGLCGHEEAAIAAWNRRAAPAETKTPIVTEAQAITDATNHLLGNMPDAMYPGGIAKWYPEARCRYVAWIPASDEHIVFVRGVSNNALAEYMRNKLCTAGHKIKAVVTAW